MISALYLAASVGYTVLLFAWLFARDTIAAFIEEATPSASLGPTLLLSVPGIVTTYFVVMAILCCWIGIALRKLHRWAWFAACAFAILSFVLDITLFVHMLRHLPVTLLLAGILRFAFLALIVAYLNRTSIRAAFGLARSRTAAQA
jgi:predicted neutral ceramidase superfamily lipid hydrolase